MTDSVVLIAFLAGAIERLVEVIFGIADALVAGTGAEEQKKARVEALGYKRIKQFGSYLLAILAGAFVAYGMDIDLFRPLLGLVPDDATGNPDISDGKAALLTTFLLAGGATPAHELIKFVQNKKEEAKANAEAPRAADGAARTIM